MVIVAAGDIACDPGSPQFLAQAGTVHACQQMATAHLIESLKPDLVVPLGDDQYDQGTLAAFQRSYDPSWGRFKAISRPAVGNHEYGTPGASGYFAYFGVAAGTTGLGWYSYDIGEWHVVVLNSNCNQVGCGHASPQLAWLTADLAAHPGGCLLAYWHHPLWSHGEYRGDKHVLPFVKALYAAGVDIVLNGHDHNYQRYTPRAPDGTSDPTHGVREFVVGTGGRSHYPAIKDPGADIVDATSFGVLQLTLAHNAYQWTFQPAEAGTFHDTGQATCHRPQP